MVYVGAAVVLVVLFGLSRADALIALATLVTANATVFLVEPVLAACRVRARADRVLPVWSGRE